MTGKDSVVKPAEELRAAIVAEARTWLRTPYHHRARVKGAGVDCAMLLAEVYERVGLIPHVSPLPYPMDWHLHRGEERYLKWVEQYAGSVSQPLPGDIALWRFGRCFSHGAIVVEWPMVIHAIRSERQVSLADASIHSQLADGRPVIFYSIVQRYGS